MHKRVEQFYRHVNWRSLKLVSGAALKFFLPTFIFANSVLAMMPDFLFNLLGWNLWKMFCHWIGFIILAYAVFETHRRQPSELKQGTNGGDIARASLSGLSWPIFAKAREMLAATMAEAAANKYPGIRESERVFANQAFNNAAGCTSDTDLKDLRPAYIDIMIARYDLLVFFKPRDRKFIGGHLIAGGLLILLPHLYNLVSIPFRPLAA